MAYTEILILAQEIGISLRESKEVKRYKELDKILTEKDCWQKYQKLKSEYEKDKSKDNALKLKEQKIIIQTDKIYIEFIELEKAINKILGDLNERIAKTIALDIGYRNQIGLLEGGKSCSKENH